MVSIISVSCDWALKIYSLFISLSPLLDNYIGYVVSHSPIKGDLGLEKSIYSLIISLASQLDSNIGYVVSHSLIKGHLGVKKET